MTTKQKREELKNDYEKFLNVKTDIEDIIFDIATKVDDFRNRKFNHSYTSFAFNKDTIRCNWDDYWSRGGEDHGHTTFPIELYYGDKSVEEYVQELDDLERKKAEAEKYRQYEYHKKQIEALQQIIKL